MSIRTTSEIAKRFDLKLVGADVAISDVAIGTQHVVPGSLFVAVQGTKHHGIEYLGQAIELGAVAILTDLEGDYSIPTLLSKDPRAISGPVADFVYGTSISNQQLFGVTGTNGKTSSVFYLSELLTAMGKSSGLISSAQISSGGKLISAELTTPEAPRLHQLLAEMRHAGQQHCAIEVSAQGITRHRVSGLRFAVAGFTNLSRDHLDDYPNMETYLAAKARLFTPEFAKQAVIFAQDDWARSLYDSISIPKVAIGIDYQYRVQPGSVLITGPHQVLLEVEIGDLMAKNLVLAVVMLLQAGFSPTQLEQAVRRIDLSVPGRLQQVSNRTPHIFVDYAHTPAAVEAAAMELRAKYPKLTILLAASGDRDRGKRPEMAQAAARYADQILITDQHPRSEDPAQIRAELRAAIADFPKLEEIADPSAAIARAIEITDSGGAILWCGPGHLKYREVKGQKLPFNAVEEARKALGHD